MKHAERLALIAFIGLLLVAVCLTFGVVYYQTVSFWAGALAAYAHAILVSLTWWGLRLARQQHELAQAGGPGAMAVQVTTENTMRGLSAGDDNPAFAAITNQNSELRTLETGFQRVVVVLSSLGLLTIAAIICWFIWGNFQILKPGQPIGISPKPLETGALVSAIGALLGYIVFFYVTRPTRRTAGYGEATHGIVTMGLPISIAVALAVLLGYFNVSYAGEVGAAAVVFFLLLQALELFFNALRNYAGIEEFDQEAVDLQALPLVPMLSSQWIMGLRILLVQSFGLARTRDNEPGVFARIMPRIIIAVLVVLVGASTLRVVPQGTEAIRERFGFASDEDISHPFKPGLHIVAPWPIDKLVIIPTEQLQQITVGADDALPVVNGKPVDFVLWTARHTQGSEEEGEYLTGEKYVLGGYVGIWWRVRNPSDFYRHVSHSDFYAGNNEEGLQGRPIYESLVRENAVYSIIHTFGTHSLEDIIAQGRGAVQDDCRTYLQSRLDDIQSGMEIVDLTIKDVHPPQGINETQKAQGVEMGPARAYEFVVSMREYRETKINEGLASKKKNQNLIKGESAAILSQADGDAVQRVNAAIGETAYLKAVAQELDGHEDVAQARLYYQTMESVLLRVNKIFVGLNVKRPNVIQSGTAGAAGVVIPVGNGQGQ